MCSGLQTTELLRITKTKTKRLIGSAVQKHGFVPRCVHASLQEALSVRPSIHPWVRNPFLKYRGNEDFKTIKHQGTHRIAFLVEIPENSRKFKKIQENSTKFNKIQKGL